MFVRYYAVLWASMVLLLSTPSLNAGSYAEQAFRERPEVIDFLEGADTHSREKDLYRLPDEIAHYIGANDSTEVFGPYLRAMWLNERVVHLLSRIPLRTDVTRLRQGLIEELISLFESQEDLVAVIERAQDPFPKRSILDLRAHAIVRALDQEVVALPRGFRQSLISVIEILKHLRSPFGSAMAKTYELNLDVLHRTLVSESYGPVRLWLKRNSDKVARARLSVEERAGLLRLIAVARDLFVYCALAQQALAQKERPVLAKYVEGSLKFVGVRPFYQPPLPNSPVRRSRNLNDLQSIEAIHLKLDGHRALVIENPAGLGDARDLSRQVMRLTVRGLQGLPLNVADAEVTPIIPVVALAGAEIYPHHHQLPLGLDGVREQIRQIGEQTLLSHLLLVDNHEGGGYRGDDGLLALADQRELVAELAADPRVLQLVATSDPGLIRSAQSSKQVLTMVFTSNHHWEALAPDHQRTVNGHEPLRGARFLEVAGTAQAGRILQTYEKLVSGTACSDIWPQ